MTAIRSRALLVVTVMSALLLSARPAAAHCDTMDGPVVKAAQLALETGDVRLVLKWIPKADEPQIRAAFERTLKVRALSPEARELADNFFFETLVRVHRASEGEPYTGLKPAGAEVEPGIELADKALDTGSVDGLISHLTSGVANGIRQRFARVQEAGRHANDSVEAGRQYVAAYVEFIHYIEGMHQTLSGAAGHAHHEAQAADAAPHQER
jgi:uncharacterized protein DUF6448